MLERLDTIDWPSLRHAHGTAEDIPGLLRSLLSDDADVWMPACAELHGTLWHQGTVYPASAAAVPFLFELLARDGGPDPGRPVSPAGCVASLLCGIATGEGAIRYGLRVDGESVTRKRLAGEGRSLEEAVEGERAWTEAVRRDVSAGLRRLLPFVGYGEGLGPLAAETLGGFPEHASWLVPAIDAALAAESDVDVRKALAESRMRLSASAPVNPPN